MKIQLIADSCCDTTPAMRNALHLRTAPLKITVAGDKEYLDDGNIQIPRLLADIKASDKPVTTAAPSPEDYAGLMRDADAAIIVTLSKHLSGSYNAAMAAKELIAEESPKKQILVLDSKSASAGETRIIFYLAERIGQGATMEQLAEEAPAFISKMRTFFVLEDLSTLIKNGRISKAAGLLGSMLMLRPIMGENGEGEIISIEKVRGTAKALSRLTEIIAQRTEGMQNLFLTLTHCNAPERALTLKKDILARCPAIGDISVTPAGGLSTCYANDGGVVIAF